MSRAEATADGAPGGDVVALGIAMGSPETPRARVGATSYVLLRLAGERVAVRASRGAEPGPAVLISRRHDGRPVALAPAASGALDELRKAENDARGLAARDAWLTFAGAHATRGLDGFVDVPNLGRLLVWTAAGWLLARWEDTREVFAARLEAERGGIS